MARMVPRTPPEPSLMPCWAREARSGGFLPIPSGDQESYVFFDQTGGLLKTGPTHTNVMDVQVILVDRSLKKFRGSARG